MNTEQSKALRQELKQLVAQTRNRLGCLSDLLRELKDLPRNSMLNASEFHFEPPSEAKSDGQIDSMKATLQPLENLAMKDRVLERRVAAADPLQQRGSGSTSDITDRLAAIKRRLAEQIENT